MTMNANMRITKVHLSADSDVTINYEEFNETTRAWGKHSITECEPPLDTLQKSLDQLAGMVRKYREEGTTDLDRYSVTGVTFFYSKTDVPGAEAPFKVIIAAHKALNQWGPANCNTPKLQVSAEDEDATLVTDDERLKIEQVSTEALRYIAGERKQVVMNFSEDDTQEGEFEFGEGEEQDQSDAAEEGEFEVVGG